MPTRGICRSSSAQPCQREPCVSLVRAAGLPSFAAGCTDGLRHLHARTSRVPGLIRVYSMGLQERHCPTEEHKRARHTTAGRGTCERPLLPGSAGETVWPWRRFSRGKRRYLVRPVGVWFRPRPLLYCPCDVGQRQDGRSEMPDFRNEGSSLRRQVAFRKRFCPTQDDLDGHLHRSMSRSTRETDGGRAPTQTLLLGPHP